MLELLDEIHPGEILLEDFMKPLGISARLQPPLSKPTLQINADFG